MQPIPPLLQQFLHLACGLTSDQAQLVWGCLSAAQRQKLTYRIERVCRRRPFTTTGDREALQFLDHLPPDTLILALERAVARGQLSRSEGSRMQECLLAEMLPDGRWK